MANKLFSVEIERSCLASMLNHKDLVVDFIPFINEDHFYFAPHKVIFLTIKNLIMSGSNIDIVIVVEKLTSIGLYKVEDIDILDYLEILQRLDSLNEDSIPEYFKVLQKYFNARQITQVANKINDFVQKNINKTSQELMVGAEKIFGEKVNNFTSENDPLDLFSGLMEEVEARGNEPEEKGIICPYDSLRDAYGNYGNGKLYLIAAPTGEGKSTIMMDLAIKTSQKNKIKALYLDSEMKSQEQRLRLTSALSGVNPWYIETGFWRQSKEMLSKVRDIWPKVKKMEGCIDHIYTGSMSMEEVTSLTRRWYYKNKSENENLIIFYDYIKLNNTHDKPEAHFKEYQIIGAKTDKLKVLAQELNCPIIAGLQTNAELNLSLSKQTAWFSDFVAILRKKNPEELQEHGNKFGTHIMSVIKGRSQGRHAQGFKDLIKLPNGKYSKIFFNFEFENFNVIEKGTLEDILKLQESEVDLKEEIIEEKSDKKRYDLKMFNKTTY